MLEQLLYFHRVIAWEIKHADFKLKNVDGKMVSLSDYRDAKGFIVIFTCNPCPYAVAYEDRIIDLDKEFKPKGYPVIAVNPNSVAASPEDSFEKMVIRAKEKGFTYPYLFDEKTYCIQDLRCHQDSSCVYP